MPRYPALEGPHRPDCDELLATLRREGTPKRVHHMELFYDGEIADAIVARYDLLRNGKANHPFPEYQKQIALRRFTGIDYVDAGIEGTDLTYSWICADDTSPLQRKTGRTFINEHKGVIASWEDFEKYPWPDTANASTAVLEWLDKNLPHGMCIVTYTGHFAENLCWLMGYETLCYALFDQRDLVQAIYDKVLELHRFQLRTILQFPRVKIVWGSDDMGFKTGLLMSPDDTRKIGRASCRERV